MRTSFSQFTGKPLICLLAVDGLTEPWSLLRTGERGARTPLSLSCLSDATTFCHWRGFESQAGLRAMGYDFDNATRFLPYDFGNGEESRLALRPLNGRPWTPCKQFQEASPLKRPADFDKFCGLDWEGNLGPTSEAANPIPAKSLYQASSKGIRPLDIFEGIYQESKEDWATPYVVTTRGNEIPFKLYARLPPHYQELKPLCTM